MSPDPVWNVILVSASLITVIYLFVIWPLAYIFLGRPFDKQFTLKYYLLEKGLWHFSIATRLWNYVAGILFQSYRYSKLKNKLFARLIKGNFAHQDRIYGDVINFRESASKWQILLAHLMFWGVVMLFVFMILTLFHNFVIYPEIGAAS